MSIFKRNIIWELCLMLFLLQVCACSKSNINCVNLSKTQLQETYKKIKTNDGKKGSNVKERLGKHPCGGQYLITNERFTGDSSKPFAFDTYTYKNERGNFRLVIFQDGIIKEVSEKEFFRLLN